MTPDPFGRAVLDHHRGEREVPLVDCDGDERREHDIEGYYFGDHEPDDRFDAALAWGTQVQLAPSQRALRGFLGDLAYVTTPGASVLLHGHAPERAETVFAYRPDPTPGIAYRVYHSEYEGEVGETLLFRLCSVDRLRAATVGTGWRVADASAGHPDSSDEPPTWLAILEKE